jgi:chaperonin cofactor prefoldin
MQALEQVWERVQEKLAAIYPEVAEEIVRKAREGEVSRRAREAYRELTGRSYVTPLEEPLLAVASELVAQRLAENYRAALTLLGVGSQEAQGASEAAPPPSEAPDSSSDAGPKAADTSPEAAEEEDPRVRAAKRDEQRWREAYRLVFGENPEEAPLLYQERLRQALAFYRQERGRRAAFEEVKALEERVRASRERAQALIGSLPEVEEEEEEAGWGTGYEVALIQLGRLTAQVEELARKLARLEDRLQDLATSQGGLKAGLLEVQGAVRELRGALEGLEKGGAGRRAEDLIRQAKAEMTAHLEDRLQAETAMIRAEYDLRMKALEEWAKRITEQFRRIVGARAKGKGLFGLFGGEG